MHGESKIQSSMMSQFRYLSSSVRVTNYLARIVPTAYILENIVVNRLFALRKAGAMLKVSTLIRVGCISETAKREIVSIGHGQVIVIMTGILNSFVGYAEAQSAEEM